jgi:hypothetical protein
MKRKNAQFLDWLAALLVGLAVLCFATGCPTEKDEPEEIPDDQPVAADFNISGLSQVYDGAAKSVKITPKEEKSTGAITVYYKGSATAPSDKGSYAVTFDVAAAGDWIEAKGLKAGTMVIADQSGTAEDPVADDFIIGNLAQTAGQVTPVTITAKTGKSGGAITIKYTSSETLPTAAGSYTVTFDVTASVGWNAVTGLSAGTLVITGDGEGPIDYAGPADLTGADFDNTWYTAGKFESKGLATGSGTTYFIDAARGDDAKDGKSVANAWKSFKNANGKTFAPGDHILLEANSIWNGEPVTTANWDSRFKSKWGADDKVGMLAPRGSGTAAAPIVIDFYVNDNGTAKFQTNQRPVINGNGTPALASNPYMMTGAITIYQEEYWEIYNIEVTNSFDFPQTLSDPSLRDTHWYKNNVIKRLCGISVAYAGPSLTRNHIWIKNCYVHDSQSEHSVSTTQNAFGTITDQGARKLKVSGGIAVTGDAYDEDGKNVTDTGSVWNDLLIEGNIIRRVCQTGIRNTSAKEGEKIIFRGNFIEYVGGDGFVLTRTKGSGANASVAEYNIIKDTCSNPNNGSTNFAGAWAIYTLDTLLQYNECYGTMYGYQDSEAFDFDGGCERSIYQYNYSHHNSGGAILFMGAGQRDCVYRLNVSANDGIGARGLNSVNPASMVGTAANTSSYTSFPYGESVFHYATGAQAASSRSNPLIYNNTIYIGDGFSIGLFGQNDTTARNYFVKFYNNILIKAGEGTVYLARAHREPNGVAQGGINTETHFRNNILWAYDDVTKPTVGNRNKFNNGNAIAFTQLLNQSGSRFVNPVLKIQKPANAELLKAHRDTGFTDEFVNDPAALEAFTGKERLRRRASLFAPINVNSPAIKPGTNGKMPGMVIPYPTNATIDNAWNGGGSGHSAEVWRPKEDFFGTGITADNWPIGAAAAPWASTAHP